MDYEEDLIEMITIGDESDNCSIVSENFQTSLIERNCDKENTEDTENIENVNNLMDDILEISNLKKTVKELKDEKEKKNEDKINNTRIIRGLVAVTLGSILGYILFRAVFYDTTRTMIAFLMYAFTAIGLYIYDQNIYPILDSVYGKDVLINLAKNLEEDLYYVEEEKEDVKLMNILEGPDFEK